MKETIDSCLSKLSKSEEDIILRAFAEAFSSGLLIGLFTGAFLVTIYARLLGLPL